LSLKALSAIGTLISSFVPLRENCSELKPPVLNAELGDKGYLDAGAKKTDSRLVNVQKMICAAATDVLSSMQVLHTSALAITGRLRARVTRPNLTQPMKQSPRWVTS
jgi:hypothetical protein